MNRKQRVRVQVFRRVQQFGEAYKSRVPATSPLGQALGKLSTTLDAFNQDAAARQSRQREGRTKLPAAREALVFQLDAIARTATVIAQTTRGFDERFVLPRPKRQEVVLAAAQGFLAEAEPHAAAFIANGLPETFIGDLRTALAEFEAASNVREAGKLARASASAGLRSAEAAGVAAIKAIDVIVRYQFAHDAEMQSAWTRAKRQDGLPLPKTDAAAPTSSPPSVSPSSPSPASPSSAGEPRPAIEPAA